MKDIRIRVHRDPCWDGYPMYWLERSNGKTELLQDDLTKRELEDYEMYQRATAILSHDAVVELMNSLWAAGIRPDDSNTTAGQISATEKHLDDMRKIVFDNFLAKEADDETV